MAAQDEEALADFKEKKKALDERTVYLQRTNLHPLLQDEDLPETLESLCNTKNNYNHLSVADQRLMNLMPLSRHENFAGSEVRESLYNVRMHRTRDFFVFSRCCRLVAKKIHLRLPIFLFFTLRTLT